jgi:DNA-binding transcriptional LysR family regulator
MSTNPITVEALKILDAIDRRGSFAKAAEELNKATSALSYGVLKLEEQLGITIFQRQGRRSVLTPAGRLILDEGRKILEATRQLAEKAKEVATGWEPKLRIAVESIMNYPLFFRQLAAFLNDHEDLEVDIRECILSGGWEALEQDHVDLVVGAPGPVPLQKGYRSIAIKQQSNLVPVIASHHPLAQLADNTEALEAALPTLRRVVIHDTATVNITRNTGLSIGKKLLYVQTTDQKVEALLAGLGIGHLPQYRIQNDLDNGRLKQLNLPSSDSEYFLAWKISNKGKALQAICQRLASTKW